ncbi:MAG: MFS transporter [Anaerolineae bacterium]|nr:MFS transporter [Anaerolineae bacterium]MDW8067694.1 MFS transporter [Anaerolineae bacterium]
MMKGTTTTRRVAVLVATCSSFLTPFMGSALNIALPSIGREFAADAMLLGWISTVYLLTSAMFLVPFGKLADLRGRKRIFVWGLGVYAAGALVSGLAPSAGALVAARAVQGVGGAMIFGTGVALLTSVFPPQERGRVLGLNVAAVYVGLSVGPFLGGVCTQQWGWRSIFYVNVPLAALVAALAAWKLRGEWRATDGESFDWPGSILYGVGLVALIYGFSRLPSAFGAGLTLAGLLVLALFVFWEGRARTPLLELNLFRHNLAFTFSNLAALVNYSATFAVGFLLSLYLQSVRGISPQQAGMILLVQPVVQALFSPLAGWASDRVEPRIVASVGMALTVIGLALLYPLGPGTAVPYIVGVLALLGFGFALFSSPNTNAVMSSVDRAHYGVASATLGTMRLTGQMLSMGIVMLIFALFMGGMAITPGTTARFLSSARAAFGVFVVLCTLGIFASLARGDIRARPAPAGHLR